MLRDHSTNGTFLDGQRVTSPRPLKPGDRIRIASFEFEFDGERLVTYDQTSHARIDALNLTRVVGHNVTILHDVTLSVLPKEMIAIVGTSGAGKSTLMDALNGFRPATTGTVLLNGRNYYHEFASMRLMVGYVPQSDVVHRDLPASHALNYAAALRMPPDTSVQEREERVSEVLDEVGLTERKNVMVNQLSGGQIKRVSIGVELLTRPSLFFLDEPTSGLDPGYERRVMELLRQMADEGRTVSLVTHATQSIELCDHVAVMARGGYLAYFGPPKLALTHFDCTEYAGMYRRLEDAKSGEDLAEKFKASEGYDRYVRARSPEPGSVPELSDRHSPVTATLEAAPHPPNNVMRQTGILIQRYAETLTRDTRNLTLLLLQAPILAVLAGLIAKRHGLTTLPDLFQARDLMVILSCSMIWLGAMNSAREIVKELPVYRRERMVGLGLLPYLTSKYIVLGALCTMQAFILLGGLALRTDLPSRGVLLPGGIELFVTLLLTAAAGLAMGLMISTLFQNADRASALIPYVLIPQIIFVVSELTGAASYIAALTISHWSFEALGTTINLAASPDALFGLSASEFTHSAPFLLSRWGIILFVGAVFATASAVFLKRHDGQLM
jgi:ABC-type multidrug transport system ATPase subunit